MITYAPPGEKSPGRIQPGNLSFKVAVEKINNHVDVPGDFQLSGEKH